MVKYAQLELGGLLICLKDVHLSSSLFFPVVCILIYLTLQMTANGCLWTSTK